MITAELAPTYKLRTNIRPVRHAYFISSRSMSQLERAMSWCCTQWGGISNLIVPVSPKGRIWPLYEHLLKMVEPDVLVSYMPAATEAGQTRHSELQAHLAGLCPYRPLSLLDDRFQDHDHAAHPLSVISDADAASQQFLDCEIRGAAEDRLSLLAVFGRVYPGQRDQYARQLRYGMMPAALQSSDYWSRQMSSDPFSSPINLTGYGVRPYKVEQPTLSFPAYFEVALGDSPAELCYFWNLRAVAEATRFPGDDRRRLLLLPTRFLRDPDSLRRFAAALRSAPPFRAQSNLDLGIYCTSRRTLRAWEDAVGQEPDFVRLDEDVRWSLRMTERPVGGDESAEPLPLTYAYLRPQLPLRFFEGVPTEIPRPTAVHFGDNEIRIEPSDAYSKRPGLQTMLDLESELWERYPRYHEVARAINDNAKFTRYGVSFLSDVPSKPSEFHFRLPSEWETLTAVFKHAGLSIRESDKSHYLEAVVQLIGGLENSDLLASRQALQLLDALAVRPAARIAQRLRRELGADSPADEQVIEALRETPIVAELSTGARSLEQLRGQMPAGHGGESLLGLLARFSKAGIVRRGYQLPCPVCDLVSWHPLSSLDEHVACAGCGSSFPLPVEQRPGTELQHHYVLNSLVNRAFDQGQIPALIAMGHVARKHSPSYCKAAALELQRGGQLLTDLDFVMFANDELIAGEAKSGSHLSGKDFRGAELAAEVGIAQFFFCTVATLDQEATDGIEILRQRLEADGHQIRVAVLTGDELLDADFAQAMEQQAAQS